MEGPGEEGSGERDCECAEEARMASRPQGRRGEARRGAEATGEWHMGTLGDNSGRVERRNAAAKVKGPL